MKYLIFIVLIFSINVYSKALIEVPSGLTRDEQNLKDINFMVYFISDKPAVLDTLKSIDVKRKQVLWDKSCYIKFHRMYKISDDKKTDTSELYISNTNCEEDVFQ